MLGPAKQRQFDRRVVSLEQLVPPDNFYRQLDAKLDLGFIRDLVRDRYAACGRPSIDPIVFFRLQLIFFFEGFRSERKLMESVALNLAQRWYAGYDFDEPLPDHSSLTRIRCRLGLALFQRFFDHVLELFDQAGLIWGQELLFDGTKVRANAAMRSMRNRWSVEARAHLAALFAEEANGAAPWALPGREESSDEREDPSGGAESAASVGPDLQAPVSLPFPGTALEEQALAEENASQWRLLEEYRLDPERVLGSGTYLRRGETEVSTTDPDATPLRPPDTGRLGFHDHYVVDGGKARIILQALVTPADVTDNLAMLDLLHRVRFRWQLHPKRAIADAKYGTIHNIVALEAAGIRAYLAMSDFGDRSGYYGAARFRYDPERDRYICPQEQELPFWRDKPTERPGLSRRRRHLLALSRAAVVHGERQRPHHSAVVFHRLHRTGQGLPRDRGLQEGDAEAASLGGTVVWGGERLARLAPVSVTRAVEGELRGTPDGSGTKPEAMVEANGRETASGAGGEHQTLLLAAPFFLYFILLIQYQHIYSLSLFIRFSSRIIF